MVILTDYLKYRAHLRGFDLAIIEQIVQLSEERYLDSETQRMIAIGRHGSQLVLVPYEEEGEAVVPLTIHATTRQQINFRLQTGRFRP